MALPLDPFTFGELFRIVKFSKWLCLQLEILGDGFEVILLSSEPLALLFLHNSVLRSAKNGMLGYRRTSWLVIWLNLLLDHTFELSVALASVDENMRFRHRFHFLRMSGWTRHLRLMILIVLICPTTTILCLFFLGTFMCLRLPSCARRTMVISATSFTDLLAGLVTLLVE